MEINYIELINSKVKRLELLKSSGALPYTLPSWYKASATEEVNAYYDKRISSIKEKGEVRVKEMVEQLLRLGYKITSHRINDKGVMTLKVERGGYKLFGFVDPSGKLILSNEKKLTVLVINYQRKNCVVHDLFLPVVLNGR